MNDKYKYLGKNTIIFALSSFGTKFLSFLLVPLYTNVLSTSEYGIADLITTTATLAIFVLTINISEAILRFALNKKEDTKGILAYGIRVLGIGSLVWMAILLLVFLSKALDWPTIYYVFIFLYFFLTALYEILSNYLRAIDKVTSVAVAGVITTAVTVGCNLLFLLLFKLGIYGYLISLVVSPAAASLYALAKIKIPLGKLLKYGCDKETKKAMRTYCIPLIFNNISLWVNAFLDKYFVTALCGVDQNGIYSVANKIPTILAMCYTVFSQAWTLSAIKEFDEQDQDGFFSQTYSVYNAVVCLVCSGLILFNIPLAKFLYAKDFFAAWSYSSVLLISVMFNALTVYMGSLFSAANETKKSATTTIISAISNTLLNAVLIPLIGALGAAIATAAAYMIMWLIRYIMLKKIIALKIEVFRDGFVYALLCLQVVLEHLEGHFYWGQIAIFGIIAVIYHGYFRSILRVIRAKVLQR